MKLKGKGVSPGIAIGPVRLYEKNIIDIPEHKVTDTDKETERFQTARSKVLKDLSGLSDKLLKDNAKDAAEILEAHREILEDEAGFISPVLERIRENKDNAAYATAYVLNEIADMFRSIDNEYMRERAQDAEDLRDSINAYILGIKGSTSSEIKESGIITAFDLAPSDTAGLDVTKVAGLMTQVGGVTGHTAIMSRTMGIPAVVGINNLMEHVDDGVMAILDGDTGEVIIDPDSSQLEYYSKLQSDYIERKKELLSFKGKPTCTCDGHYVRLKANVGTADDVKTSASCDAEGIGLVRTEFLYMKRKELPTEQEQFDAYRSILNEMGKNPLYSELLTPAAIRNFRLLSLKRKIILSWGSGQYVYA
jgi:phosphotransferase system enzyme I (PtsI)